jgi:hypothetical protein
LWTGRSGEQEKAKSKYNLPVVPQESIPKYGLT